MALRPYARVASVALTLFVAACSSSSEVTPEPGVDADVDTGVVDTGATDTGATDTGATDTGTPDTSTPDDADSTVDDAADTATDDAADTATDDADAADTATDDADAADTATTDADAGCEAGATETCAYSGDLAKVGVGICKAGVRTCTGGAFGACTGEVLPGTESCNGQDDDCDGSTDEGCPASASIGDPTTGLTGYGNATGGTMNTDTCPAGSALVGINVVVNDYLRQIQGICAPIQVVETTSSTPYTYSVTTGTQTTMPNRGDAPGTDATATCPAGTYVVGVEARAGLRVDQLTLSCAPLNVTGTIGTYAVARGAVTKLAPVGGTGGGPKESATCAGHGVVNKLVSRTGTGDASGVDYVELGCATPALTLKS